MKKTISLLLLLSVIFMPVKAQDVENVKPVKNVILLIPDGTSLATVSMARWLQWYTNPDKPKLNIDPYLCGTVRTAFFRMPRSATRSYDFLLHDRTTQPYRLRFHLPGERR